MHSIATSNRRQRGFTLIELLITVVIIGIVSAIMAPVLGELISSQRQAYNEKHNLNNQLIAKGLTDFARNSSPTGRLPAPYTGGGYDNTIYNPADASTAGVALTQALTQTGVQVNEINDDGTTARMVRAYQVLTTPTIDIPLYFQSGPLVTLNYDFGVLYLSQCARTGSSCNPNGATGVPGSSPTLTAANLATYETVGTDGRAQFVSSLPVQKEMLARTTDRLEKVRNVLLGYLRSRQISAAAGDQTNWFPNQLGNSAAGSLGGAAPGSNQGCRDGWYTLGTNTQILLAVGLSPEEFGQTAWGGPIQYCRDYDPSASGSANAPPHYGALRINKSVTTGAAPSAVPADNIVLTF
ncbi:prepilin-type N-terminal cleavage/methylation domain-containing protein [Hydrogenophaga sp. 2FB]|uniref:type II secretion system protein n=1 Tax=Hydrogenophaga sp. 2FB TaxID=2502187 RepID=UPI001484FD4C|nr:prepilin-type N-terminal cleavage/methylation domain-containing protein [Hydrogenophaga sp. 2FB]